LFFGDERCVPPDDPRSNYGLAKRTLLDGVPLRPGHVLPIPTDGSDAAGAAAAYSGTLAAFFDAASGGPPPRFDLVLLGLGQDGHTASLLPGAAALHEHRLWVTWSPPGTLPPLVDRITLTYPVLNAARHLVFLVTGANKAPALREALETEPALERLPAVGVRPVDGTLAWLVDAAAAALLQTARETSS
jgi:6-phosphogluconolactonase